MARDLGGEDEDGGQEGSNGGPEAAAHPAQKDLRKDRQKVLEEGICIS